MNPNATEVLLKAIRNDGRYPPGVYEFLHAGLEYTTRSVFGGGKQPVRPRHVTGQELCEGLRELALQRWGLLAKVVLNHWNVRCTRDFGEMVYFLIDLGLMGKQETDQIEDFDEVYDFDEAFGCYEIAASVEGN